MLNFPRVPAFIAGAFLLSCSSHDPKVVKTTDDTSVRNVTYSFENLPGDDKPFDDFDHRADFINSYKEKGRSDTVFISGTDTINVHLQHYCTWDSSLVIPEKYNFDTDKPFVTHQFQSDLLVLKNSDTAFRKIIAKTDFDELLFPALKEYGTLLFPKIEIKDDSIHLGYSLSIPVTDVGIPTVMSFNLAGNYIVRVRD